MTTFLVILALGLAAIGALTMSQATMGAALIGMGCLFGILARLAQASVQHKQLLALLAKPEAPAE